VRREAAAIGREWNPDLVHLAYTPVWGSLAVGARLERLAPLIATVHGPWRQFFAGGPAVARRVLDEAAWVTACSRDTMQSARMFEPAITGRSSVILNGLDSPDPPTALPRDEAPLVVAAARLAPEKGFDVLLRAFASMRGRLPRARLVLAGRGLEEDALTALADELGIAEAVDFLGWVARDKIEAVLDRAAVVAVPSRMEGFGLTALEAALRARPVVASRVDGLPEVVEDGVTGVLVPPDDPDALAAELVALIEDPDRAERIGRAARERAQLHFGEERYLRDHEALYLRLGSQRSSTADTITQ
jgi:glycosyltransferase involved in cell wall biosynthesis